MNFVQTTSSQTVNLIGKMSLQSLIQRHPIATLYGLMFIPVGAILI